MEKAVREIFDPDRVRSRQRVLREDHDPLTERVIGAAIDVHRALGPGFVESVYEEALCMEMASRKIPFTRQHTIRVTYKDKDVGECRLDFLVDNELVVELKAVESLTALFAGQVVSYLRAANLRKGLLINFNVPLLKDGVRRITL